MRTANLLCHGIKLNEFTILKWPPQPPDQNPIEHFWDVVGWEIHIMDMLPTNNCVMLSCQCGTKSLRNVYNTTKNEDKKGSKPVLARCP